MLRKLSLLILSISLLAAFTYFSYLVKKSVFNQLDFDLTVKIQDKFPRKWDEIFLFISLLASPLISSVVWLGVFIFTILKRFWLTALLLPLFFVGVVGELFGKLVLYHPGPQYMFYRGGEQLSVFTKYYVHTEYSYPSGHATRAAFLITFMIIFLISRNSLAKSLPSVVILLGILLGVGASKVYLGEHWATDIIGGILLGVALGCLTATTIPSAPKVI